MIFGSKECWHSIIEKHCANPLEPPSNNSTMCGRACPYCLGTQNNYIMKVRKDGVKSFLLCTFLGSNSDDKFPSYILKQLKEFPNVGRAIYIRPKSEKPPDSWYLESTILRLISSGILGLDTKDEDGKARVVLKYRLEDSMPCYMIDEYWDSIDTVAPDDLVTI